MTLKGYLPLQHSSRSTSSSPSSRSSTPDYARPPSYAWTTFHDNRHSFLWDNLPQLNNKRRILWLAGLALIQITLIIFAIIGIVSLISVKAGWLTWIRVYSSQEIQTLESGWIRPSLTLDSTVPNLDYSNSPQPFTDDNLLLHDFSQSETQTSINSLHVLILCPLRNSAEDLPGYFSLLDSLEHPKINTSMGFLVGDSDEATGIALREQVDQRLDHYRRVSILRKDFHMMLPDGKARHISWVQTQRRSVMARARSYLLSSTLEPTIDWVLWIDSDVEMISTSLISDLLMYGGAGFDPMDNDGIWNDVIVPNVLQMYAGNLRGYDLNNWAETSTSLQMQKDLAPDHVLVEGQGVRDLHRLHLVDEHVAPNVTAMPFYLPPSSSAPSYENNLFNASDPAYIGKQVPLEGVGGVVLLVRAEVHRMGGYFPSFPVGNQVETEGFGRVAKRLGARIVGLPNYWVLHSRCPPVVNCADQTSETE